MNGALQKESKTDNNIGSSVPAATGYAGAASLYGEDAKRERRGLSYDKPYSQHLTARISFEIDYGGNAQSEKTGERNTPQEHIFAIYFRASAMKKVHP